MARKKGTVNHCGRCTSIPIGLVQIWVLHLKGFPCKFVESSLSESRHLVPLCTPLREVDLHRKKPFEIERIELLPLALVSSTI